MAKKKVAANEDFFVNVPDPAPIKVALLECRKAILESMKIFRKFREIRKEKNEEKTKLRKQLREISSILNKMRAIMPHVNLPTEEIVPKESMKEEKQVSAQRAPKRTEIERIESELEDIERKLSTLG